MQLPSLCIGSSPIPLGWGIRKSTGKSNRKEKLNQDEIQTLPKSIGASLLTSVGFWCSTEKSNRLNGKQINLLDAQIPQWMMPWAETRDHPPISSHYGFHILYITHTHADLLNNTEKRKHQNKGILCYLIKYVKKYARKSITLHLHFCLQH